MGPTAPPIDGQTWLDHDPIRPAQMYGRVVVLVFWAASCEASLRCLQQVQEIVANSGRARGVEPTDPDVMAVAVHSPRMPVDDDVERLRHTVARHRITVPVVHDPRFQTWSRYNPPGWPSIAVIDGNGKSTGIVAGCRNIGIVEDAIQVALDAPKKRRRRDDARDRLDLTSHGSIDLPDPPGDTSVDKSTLRYPEGLSVVDDGGVGPLIAVADGGHDRVLIGRFDQVERRIVVETLITGLDQPAGLTFLDEGQHVAVVERGGNVVSTFDVVTGDRTIVATGLERPTGITVDRDGSLVICDGGGDRLYRAVANSTRSGYLVYPVAGSGRTGTKPGDAAAADLAQPSAVVRSNAGLLFSDAASNNLRLLTDDGQVVNITDCELFDWGLVDGLAHRARLQRPGDLCVLDDGSIIFADEGNNRLRRFHQRRITTLGLSGLNSPSAVATLDSRHLLVADANNHRLITVDTAGQTAWPVTLELFSHSHRTEAESYVSSGKTVDAT